MEHRFSCNCIDIENPSNLTGTEGSNPRLSAFAERFKTQCFSTKPRGCLGVSLRLRTSVLAPVRDPVPWVQECKKGKTVTIRGKLNGTNPGTSAPRRHRFSRPCLRSNSGSPDRESHAACEQRFRSLHFHRVDRLPGAGVSVWTAEFPRQGGTAGVLDR